MRFALFLTSLSFAFSLAAFGSVKKYSYQSVYSSKTENSFITFEAVSNGFKLKFLDSTGNAQYSAELNEDYTTAKVHSVNIKDKTDVTLEKKEGKIFASGTLQGKPVKKDFDAKKSDFRHYFSFQMTPFILSKDKMTTFVSLRPDTLEPFEFEVRKDAVTNLMVHGVSTETVRVKINLAGPYSMFWTGIVYYRTSDGLFVRDEEKDEKGKPVIVELVKEE